LKTAKNRVTTYLPNYLALKMEEAKREEKKFRQIRKGRKIMFIIPFLVESLHLVQFKD